MPERDRHCRECIHIPWLRVFSPSAETNRSVCIEAIAVPTSPAAGGIHEKPMLVNWLHVNGGRRPESDYVKPLSVLSHSCWLRQR